MIERLIPFKLQLFAVGFSILLLLFIVELIRKNRLKEGYSILWFLLGISLLVISIWTGLLRGISRLVGVDYEPAMLLSIIMLGAIVLLIHFSVLVSSFDRINKALAQNIGFINLELKNLREKVEQLQKDKLNGSTKPVEEPSELETKVTQNITE